MFTMPSLQDSMIPATQPLRFPQKLWKIANDCKTGAVCWSLDGESILLRYSLFKEEYMSSKHNYFKTDNIASFVRQLNLYGFRKVYENTYKQAYKAYNDLHEFTNVYFQRDRPDLLDKVVRKSVLKDKNELLSESGKSADFADESSSDKGEKSNISAKSKALFCRKANEVSPPSKKKTNDGLVIRISQNTDVKKKQAESTFIVSKKNIEPKRISNDPEQVQKNPCKRKRDNFAVEDFAAPVKKKRGRKPGSKRKQRRPFEFVVSGSKISYSATLKNPKNYPKLLYYNDDDDDGVFLRHTSKDVMLSSTLPFQESIEYHELKAAYLRQCEMKMDTFRDYKSMFNIL